MANEPTPAMQQAGVAALRKAGHEQIVGMYGLVSDIWRAMQAAQATDTVNVAIKPSLQLLEDIVETALYDCIQHWAVLAEYARNANEFPHLVLRELDEDKESVHTVTAAVLVRGVQLVLDTMDHDTNARISVFDAITTDDAGSIDSDAADCIFQMGLFGKIVYS